MIRITSILVLLALANLLAPVAQAQVCIDFLNFCDGLELTVEGQQISGFWRNVDCEGLDAPVVGLVQEDIPSPCDGEVGIVGVACDFRFGCEIFGDEWYIVLNEPGGTWDLGRGDSDLPPPGACALRNIEYEVLLGPCPFASDSSKSAISSLRAARAID